MKEQRKPFPSRLVSRAIKIIHITHQWRIVRNNDKICDRPRNGQYQWQCYKHTKWPTGSRYDNRCSIDSFAQYKHVPKSSRTTTPKSVKVSNRAILCHFTLPPSRHGKPEGGELRQTNETTKRERNQSPSVSGDCMCNRSIEID